MTSISISSPPRRRPATAHRAGGAKTAAAPTAIVPTAVRPRIGGKFFWAGNEKLYVRGVTYGTFRPDAAGDEFPDRDQVASDFTMMRGHGINTVRTYTAPPRWFLDTAQAQGLRVLVGLAAERFAGYLCEGRSSHDLCESVHAALRRCVGHPAVFAYALGNEIPASTVRWLGRRRVERDLERLCRFVRRHDPGALVTYVNYPTTEYIDLPSVDFLSFNVYLESDERLDAYLARSSPTCSSSTRSPTPTSSFSAPTGRSSSIGTSSRSGCPIWISPSISAG